MDTPQDFQSRELQDLSSGLGYSTDKTLARYFSTSRKTIWTWAREGRIPKPHKISANMTRWANDELQSFLRTVGDE